MSIKSTIRAAIDLAAQGTGVLAQRLEAMRDGLTILTYHRVLPDNLWSGSPLPGLVMPLSAFEAQVRLLRDRFETVTVSEGLKRLAEGRRGEKPLVGVTFDDGYLDNHEHARLVLDRAGVRATFFVTAGHIGTTKQFWHDSAARRHAAADAGALAGAVSAEGAKASWLSAAQRGHKPTLKQWMDALKAMPRTTREAVIARVAVHPDDIEPRAEDGMMSVEMVRELARGGHEIGGHTMTHPILSQEDDASLRVELEASKAMIESWLGAPIRGIAYPNGDSDERVRERCRGARYAYGVTTAPGRAHAGDEPLLLKRLDMNSRVVASGNGLANKAAWLAEVSLFHEALRGTGR